MTRLKVRIEKQDGRPGIMTLITDAETGELVFGIQSYRIEASVYDEEVLVTLHRVELRVVDGALPEYDTIAEVVHLKTDAIEVDPCSSSTPSAATDQPSTAESDPT